MAFGAFLSGAAVRHVAARLGSPGTVVLGLALEVVGVVAVALVLDRDVAAWFVTLLLAVYGVGVGLTSAEPTSTVLADIPVGESDQGSATQSTVRHVRSALGPAVVGAVLSLGPTSAVPDALGGASAQGDELADATRTSAGGVIGGLCDAGVASPLGASTPDVVPALSDAFAGATSLAMLVAAGSLLVGLVASVRVMVVARQEPANHDA